MTSSSLFRAALSVLLAGGALACGGPRYDHTVVSEVSTGDLPATVSLQTLSLPEGAAVKAIVTPYNDEGKAMSITVTSDAPNTLDVVPGISATEFVFMGRAVGKTSVRFAADGQVVAIANAEVTPQASP